MYGQFFHYAQEMFKMEICVHVKEAETLNVVSISRSSDPQYSEYFTAFLGYFLM